MDKLTTEQSKMFHSVHAKHLKAMGTAEQAKHQLEQVTRVVWDDEENGLKVYFADGEWWHYGSDGEWY